MWRCVGCGESVEGEFGVCWNCGTSRDGVADPGFVRADDAPAPPGDAPAPPPGDAGPSSAAPPAGPVDSAACPFCGAAAERGCVYGSDKGFSLRWIGGPPGLLGNLAAGIGGGERVGGWGFGSGPYAEGFRCDRCRRIVLEY